MASAWLPLVVRGTADFRGRRALDGGVLTLHPYKLALDDGCTHVLSLSTRPIGSLSAKLSLSQRYAVRHLNRLRDGLGTGYAAAAARYRDERRELVRRMTEPGDAPYVLDLAPLPWMPPVSRQELDSGLILAGARGAYEVMHCAIEGVDPSYPLGRVRAIPRLTIAAKNDG